MLKTGPTNADDQAMTNAPNNAPLVAGSPTGIGPVEAFWRFRSWTVPVTIVIGLLAGLAALATSGTSTATTTLYLTDPRGAPVFRDGSSAPADLSRYARQRAEFAASADVFNDVIEQVELLREDDPAIQPETVDSLDQIVAARTTTSSDVRVECTSDDADRALRICGLIVESYVRLTNADIQDRAEIQISALLTDRDRLIADPEAQDSSIALIDGRIAEIRAEAALFGSGVEFVEPPEVEEDSRILPAVQFGLAGLLFAAFAVAALAWFRAGRRPVVNSGSDATLALNAPLLGEIARGPEGPFVPTTPPGAEYQLLATSLGALQPTGGLVLAGAARPVEHTAETIARLATASAREGRRILVVDGDTHGQQLSRLFGIEHTHGGLTELMAGLISFDEVRRPVGVGGAATLDLVTGGRPIDDPASLYRSQQGRDALEAVRDRYDLVLVAIPPLLTTADGSALAASADGVVMVVDRGRESTDLDTVRQRLAVLQAPVIGVVFDHRMAEATR